MSCCPESSLGAYPYKVPETCKGKVITVSIESHEAVDVYVTGQVDFTKSERVLIIFKDIYPFGCDLGFELSDTFVELLGGSSKNVTVIMPDYWRKDAPMSPDLTPAEGFPLAFKKIGEKFGLDHLKELVNGVLLPWLKKEGMKVKDIGLSALGTCFGAWVNARLMSEDTENIWRCSVSFHPSLQVEEALGLGTVESIASSIKEKPFYMMPAGDDPEAIKPGGAITQMLAKARGVTDEEVSVPFENMVHGWSIRGDKTVEEVKLAQQKAYDLAAAYFVKYHFS